MRDKPPATRHGALHAFALGDEAATSATVDFAAPAGIPADGAGADGPATRRSRWAVPLIAFLTLLVPLLILAIVKLYGPQLERDAYTSLEIAARLKAQQVESWLAERRSDGRVLAADAELIERIADLRRRADAGEEALVRQRLDALSHAYGYAAAYLLDPQGKVLLAQGAGHEISAQTRALLPRAFAGGDVIQSDFYLDTDDDQAALNFVVPLQRTVAGKRQAVAALVLHAEPAASIFPLILAWPSASPSGETLLVQGVGESVVFLNQLRHIENTALKLKRPLAAPMLPAAIAVRTGQAGMVRGRDYRDTDVLAAYRPIAGTDWHLVAKLDYDEVIAPLWNLVLWVGLITLAAIIAVGVMLRLVWSQQERLLRLASRARQAQSLRQREARFRALTETAYDAFVSVDADGNIVGWNPSATRMFGFAAAEIIGQSLTRIIPARFQQAAMDGFQRMMNGDPDGRDRSVVQLVGRRQDDSEFLLERSVALWQTEANRFCTCVIRDITERKRIDDALRESEARYRSIFENANTGIASTDADGRVTSFNEAFRAMLGYDADALRRMNFADFTHPDDLDAEVILFNEIVARQREHYHIEKRYVTCGERVIWVDISVAVIRDAQGEARNFVGMINEITARRQAQQALEASRNFNEQIFLASPIGILTYDATGQCLTANSNAVTQIGGTQEQVLGQNFRHLDSWKSSGLLACAEATLASGVATRKEAHFHTSFGREVWQEAVFARFLADGQMHLLLMVADISRRKQQEEQTQQLLVLNETILSNALVGIVYLKQRRIVSCNRRLEELFQYEPGELLGESSERLYDSRETFENVGATAYQAVAEGRNYSTEVVLRHKDGSLFWGALSGRAIDPARPHEGSIWIYADISERRRAEQESGKLLQAVEQSPVSIVITDRNGLIEYVNPNFTRITGYAASEAIGQSPRILKTGETPRTTHEELWRTVLDGRIWRGVLRNRCKNGELIWEDTSISPIFDAAGDITHFVAVKDDVTERKRIEQQLEQHQAHLEDLVVQRTAELSTALEAARLADRSKDEFLANITHELRTPLSAVIGFSSLARPFCTDARQREYLDKVNSAGKTLADIIDDLLDLSKIVAGRMAFEAAPFSLRQLVVRSSSVISYKAQEKGLELVERIDADIPDILVGDSLRVEQILLNLLSNAVKFTAAGRVELRVGLHARAGQRVCLSIEVEDTGIGLRSEEIALLFKPFSQADASVTRKFGGTGLGLAICKRLAELMDGEISVTSREGSGSTFRVRLWLGLAETGELPPAEGEKQEPAQLRYQDARVLVVDDQPFNREVVEGLLAVVGITPQLAEDGQSAVDILSGAMEAFDLVLMDIQMPVMDGLTATRVIRKLDGPGAVPIIAMTAHTMAHEKEQSLDAGMNDHIGKPFDEADFYSVLAKWIPRGKQQLRIAADARPASANGLPALRGIDTRAGLALLLGDEARYRYWLADFIVQAPAAMTQIHQALAGGKAEPAGMAAHTLKGRTGLLGMKQLHAMAAALEAAIDGTEPASELLLDLERGVAAMCEEIRNGLGLANGPEPAAEPLPETLPPGLAPASVARLIASLHAGDSDTDRLVAACLAELADTAWAPHLRQAQIHIRNFDYVAAGRLLAGERQEQRQGN